MRRRRLAATTALVLVAGIVAGGCGPALVPPAAAEEEIETFGACDALLDRIHEAVGVHVGAYGFDDAPVMTEDFGSVPDVQPAPATRGPVRSDAAPPARADSPATTATADSTASGTNVQEAGVDEDDSVKTGPGRILVLESSVLRYIDVTGGDPRARGTLPVGFDAATLLTEGDHVLVVGSTQDGADGRSRVVVAEVDVSDPDALRLGSTVRVTGTLTAARSAAGVARLVVESVPDFAFVYPGGVRRGPDRAGDTNRAVVGASTLADWLPEVEGGPRPDCTKVMIPRSYAGAGMLTVMSLDMSTLRVLDSAALMARGEIVYDSGTTMYVATPSMPAGTGTGDGGTEVHAFDVSGRDSAVYVASGTVPGRVEDRWAMSESGGFLRVVTTGDGPGVASSSSLVTLERDGSKLVTAGAVDGLGRGEQVKAVRFVGDLAYVVTFKRTDPLWVLDLRDAKNPRVSGELHVPGYSAYLHPIGDSTLVGVGQDADEATGRPLGLKVALYDVSDPSRPLTAAEWHAGPGTASPAEADPHAFLWWAPTGTVAIPMRSSIQTRTDVPTADGAPVATLPAAPTTAVLHAESSTLVATGSLTCAGPTAPGYEPTGDRRSVVVGDSLFSICPGGVAGYRLDGLAPTGQTTWH